MTMYELRLRKCGEPFAHAHIVAISPSREALQAFLDNERVPIYEDDGFIKRFLKGGPLEKFDPPSPPHAMDGIKEMHPMFICAGAIEGAIYVMSPHNYAKISKEVAISLVITMLGGVLNERTSTTAQSAPATL